MKSDKNPPSIQEGQQALTKTQQRAVDDTERESQGSKIARRASMELENLFRLSVNSERIKSMTSSQ